MGLFDLGKKKKEKGREQNKEKEEGGFIGFVLLSSPSWDKERFIRDFMEDWGIDVSPGKDSEEDGKYDDVLYQSVGKMNLTMGFIPAPVPDGEVEHYAAANYMWPQAVEITKEHKAQLIVAVLGEEEDVLAGGKLLVKAAATCMRQENAIGFYSDGAVFQPEFYREFALLMKEDQLPVMDLVWFGLYGDGKRSGIYTYGMKKFRKDEMEVYVDADNADLNDIRDFMVDIVSYVLEYDVVLKDGETIGFSADQKLPITLSKGIALDGDTLKIGYWG